MDKNYTVLLVDDEEEVIDIMKKKIDWESLGFEVLGTAHNGVKALEIAEEHLPDVVMTDIQMPYMDGLELSRRLKKEFPDLKILLFTGFDEFEYAKEAIHLEIEEYILKPINSIELRETLSKVKNTLDKEREEKLNVEKLQNYYSASLPMMQSNFYTMLIEGRIAEANLNQTLMDYGMVELLANPTRPLVAVVFHTSKNHVPEGISPLMLQVSVQQYADERLREKWKAAFFTYLGETVMIATLENVDQLSDLTDDCNRICRSAERQLSAVVTAGIGSITEHILDIRNSYNGAREAISYRVLYGTGRAINIHEIAPMEQEFSDVAYEGSMHELLKQIRMGSVESVEQEVHSYIEGIRDNSANIRQYRITVMELISAIYRFAGSNGIKMEDVVGDVDLYTKVPEMDLETLEDWLLTISKDLQTRLSDARNSSYKSYVENAKDYVKEHYSDQNLSLDTICPVLGVSESYFSSIFKKETGEAFISFLTNYRMEEAARLIQLTNDKNYVIGEKVGYADANYFSYVFKKHFGMSPSKYRQQLDQNR